jgi:hypothetical protein
LRKRQKDHELPKEPTLKGSPSSPRKRTTRVASPGAVHTLPLPGYRATGIYVSACGPFGGVWLRYGIHLRPTKAPQQGETKGEHMADGPHTANRPGNGEGEEEEEEKKKEKRVKTGGEARKNIQHVIGGRGPDLIDGLSPDPIDKSGPVQTRSMTLVSG